MPATRGEAGRPSELPSGWVAALSSVFPEFDVIDRDLDLGEGRSAQLVGVDAAGRLVLVLFVDGESESAVLGALDALVFYGRNRAVLASHFKSTRLRAGVGPLVALVAESFSEKLLGRLSGMNQEFLRVLEMRAVSSARGERSYLVPILPGTLRPGAAELRAPTPFVDMLPPEHRKLAELLLRRIDRIDDQLVQTPGDKSLTWRLGDELLCCVLVIEGAVEGQVPPVGRPRRIASSAEVEAFLDEVLARYVALLAAGGREPDDPPVEMLSVDAGALLTPEEIAAFRQPG